MKMIDFDLLNSIWVYAGDHATSSHSHYSSRGSSVSIKKLFRDCLCGKIAEFNLYFYLKEKGYNLDAPDIEIYDSNSKSYARDLYIKDKDIHLHVKSISQDSMSKYGKSFTMQKNDPIVVNPKPNHFLVPMLEVNFLKYDIHSWLSSESADYKPTKTYQPDKVAIYLD